MKALQVIKRPLVLTEKARVLSDSLNQVVFEVDLSANKIEICAAIQSQFKVAIVNVRTSIVRGKMRRMGRGYEKMPNWKKAVVTLKAGDKIGFFDATSVPSSAGVELTASSEQSAQ